ncbi:MAG TPA: hypothetical protein RMH99_21140 [Sandaracinaceae bacterium LLY-WYZ-13_1]|nr:hypothetical protein [Sandaracinaceae bacterium LLY-WYZ-13_1]
MFWTPSTPMVQQGLLYGMGVAAEAHAVRLHQVSVMPNHYHWEGTPTKANLPAYLRSVHRESACFLQECLREHGYEAPPSVWDKRPTHVMQLVDAGAQMRWPVYSYLNPVQAGLVERVEDYPGFVSDLSLMRGGVVVVKRPPIYFSEELPAEIALRFGPPPGLVAAFGGDMERAVHWMRKEARDRERQLRERRRAEGRGVVGASVVARVHPWSEPRTPCERGRPAPEYLATGDLDVSAREMNRRLGLEVTTYREDQGSALKEWRGGNREVEFPYGTYQMRVLHGVRIAEPREGAILCAPRDVDAIEWEGEALDPKRVLADSAELLDEALGEAVDDLRDVTDPSATAAMGTEAPTDDAIGLEPPARSAGRPHPRKLSVLRTRRRRRKGRRGKRRKPS